MKVILSRKGFDAQYGGVPSPIFPDGRMVSLPIPSERSFRRYRDLQFGGISLGSVVEQLTRKRINADDGNHLDPDLNAEIVARMDGWLPAFGQTKSAQGHLAKQSVGVGDLFLFFGWFALIRKGIGSSWEMEPTAYGVHAVFGWLQVGEVINVGRDTATASKRYPWLSEHPHLIGDQAANNTVYLAANRLSCFAGADRLNLPGGGVFGRYAADRVLTYLGQPKRSLWSLPAFMSPARSCTVLSYHGNTARWRDDGESDRVLLQTVAKGQEFVLSTDQGEELNHWLLTIFGGR